MQAVVMMHGRAGAYAEAADCEYDERTLLSGRFLPRLRVAYAERVVETVRKRLRGSIHVAPQDPSSAVREIERLAGHPQLIQVMLPIVDRAYGDPFYHPIFEAAQRHHLDLHVGEQRQ